VRLHDQGGLASLKPAASIPLAQFDEIEMINGGEGEEFVQRWYHVVVLDIGQTADMQDEIGPPAIHGNLKTGSLDVASS
jgi:hypothetical protein